MEKPVDIHAMIAMDMTILETKDLRRKAKKRGHGESHRPRVRIGESQNPRKRPSEKGRKGHGESHRPRVSNGESQLPVREEIGESQ